MLLRLHQTTQYYDKKSQIYHLYEEITKLNNTNLIYCSATPIVNLFDEKRSPNVVCKLKPRNGYVGPSQLQYKEINIQAFGLKDDITNHPALLEFYDEIHRQEPVLPAKKYGLLKSHPQFLICQLSRYQCHHHQAEATLIERYPDEFNTIEHNCEKNARACFFKYWCKHSFKR